MPSFAEKDLAFSMPTRIRFGSGSRSYLGDECVQLLREQGKKGKVVLVCREARVDTELHAAITASLDEQNLEYSYSHSIMINPSLGDTDDVLKEIKELNPDIVVAIGGGSTIDTVKSAMLFEEAEKRDIAAGAEFNRLDYFPGPNQKQIPPRSRYFIVMPTTAGTGSEATPYASLELHKDGDILKKSIASRHGYPDVAIVDPELTATKPLLLTAATGLDALCQAIESYWSRNASVYSRLFSLPAVGLVYHGLLALAENLDDKEARAKVALGANYAGIGISQAQTTAIHATSYPLTTMFGISHGEACALTLAAFMEFNSEYLAGEGRPILEELDAESVPQAANNVRNLMDKLGMKRRLSDFGIKKDDLPAIVKRAFRPDRAGNNPRLYDADDLTEILEKLL